MKSLLILIVSLMLASAPAQEAKYDQNLAKSLGGNDNGMKKYVFVILRTGSNTSATSEEKKQLFEGHMANIQKLAADKKLAVAGPFGQNEQNYRGIFILNVESVDEAKALTETDPAVKAKLLDAEYIPWFGTAALLETVNIHERIVKPKP